MPVISQRGIDIPSSPIRKLTPLANNAKARGIKVYICTPEVKPAFPRMIQSSSQKLWDSPGK